MGGDEQLVSDWFEAFLFISLELAIESSIFRYGVVRCMSLLSLMGCGPCRRSLEWRPAQRIVDNIFGRSAIGCRSRRLGIFGWGAMFYRKPYNRVEEDCVDSSNGKGRLPVFEHSFEVHRGMCTKKRGEQLRVAHLVL